MKFSVDCKHFLGERPCKWQRLEKVECQCKHYVKVRKKFLLIKVQNLREILAITKILPLIKKHYGDHQLTWLVDEAGAELIKDNPNVDRIYLFMYPDIELLKVEEFDIVACLDRDRSIVALSDQIKSVYRYGYELDKAYGVVVPSKKLSKVHYRLGFERPAKLSSDEIANLYANVLGLHFPKEN